MKIEQYNDITYKLIVNGEFVGYVEKDLQTSCATNIYIDPKHRNKGYMRQAYALLNIECPSEAVLHPNVRSYWSKRGYDVNFISSNEGMRAELTVEHMFNLTLVGQSFIRSLSF